MKICVIGGSGFIGTRLIDRLLVARHQVSIFDKAPSLAYPALVTLGDVRDARALEAAVAGCDLAIMLAAEHRDDVRPRSLYHAVNVGGAHNLVQAASAQNLVRLMFVSSVAVYGLRQPLADECAPLRPDDAYGRSKVDAEAVYRAWAQADADRCLSIVRPCVVFGEGNRGNVYTLIDHLRRGRFAMVGSGGNRKSIAYVGNLVDFLVARLDAGAGTEIFNYADKPDFSTCELIDELRSLMPAGTARERRIPYAVAMAGGYALDLAGLRRGKPFGIGSLRIRKFCTDTRVSSEAAYGTGFRPAVSIREGLVRMIAALEE